MNFTKVLQKRKEFYSQHWPTRAPDGSATVKHNYTNKKMLYNNEDFLNNLHDKCLVTEITGGDPTYDNKRLYK